MAEQHKGDSSSKEKKSLLDLDIGKDFLSSWKSISIAEGDEMDFDLTPGPGNNKSFKFDKADIDFNLDGDFGKMTSFNMDMSDLDISPSLKKDEKSKEKPKESSSSVKDKGKADRFTFAFDFDELDNFNFEPNLTKDGLKDENYKNKKENSQSGSGFQAEEGSMHKKHNGSIIISEDDTQKPSLNGTVINLDMESPVGEDADLETIKENRLSKFAVDDDVTSEHSAAICEVASIKATGHFDTSIASTELPKVSPSEKLVSAKPVELEDCNGNDGAKDNSSASLFRNEPNGGHSPEEHDDVISMSTNTTNSNEKHDFNHMSVDNSSCHYQNTIAGNSHRLRTVDIAEENNSEKSEVGVEDPVVNKSERVEVSQVKTLVERSVTTSSAPGILGDKTSAGENNDLALEISKLPLVSQTADMSEKETNNGRETSAPCSKSFIQSEKSGCAVSDVSNQITFSSCSSRKMGFIQPSLVERKRKSVVSNEGYTRIASLPLQYSKPVKTMLKEVPKIQKQESSVALNVPSADELEKGKKLNDSSAAQVKVTETMKPVLGQREKSVKDLNDLRSSCPSFSLEVNKNATHKGGNPTSLAAIQISNRSMPVEGHNKLFSIERGRKTPDPPGVKLQCLNFDSTKSPIRKDINPVGSIGQNKVLLRKPRFDIAHSSNSQKQILTTAPSTKRKTPEGISANITALHPSKRLAQSPAACRNDVDTSEKIPDRKVPNYSNVENKNIESTIVNTPLSTLHVSHEATAKEVNMPFSIESNNNIKQAEAYAKELDDLCNILRKKHDEAKELLVHAVVNNNKLLMLNNPLLDEKIRATQSIFARYTLNISQG